MTDNPTATTAATIASDTCAVLDLAADQVDFDADLTDYGLDSLRLMTLVEKWREAGYEVDFVSLATEPVLNRWIDHFDGAQ